MLKTSVIILSLLPTLALGQQCDLLDEANFPSTSCSFVSLGVSTQELRFGRVDELKSGSDDDIIILRSGSSLFEINENSEVLRETNIDDDDVECGNVDIQDYLDNEIAYVLEGDSLNAPRKISKIWILDCEVSQPR